MAAISEASPMWAPSGAHETVLYPAKLLPVDANATTGSEVQLEPRACRMEALCDWEDPSHSALALGRGLEQPRGSCHERPGSTGKPEVPSDYQESANAPCARLVLGDRLGPSPGP